MQEQEHPIDPADRELEAALRTLSPAVAALDPVGAAFEAGRRTQQRRVRRWQSAAAVVLIVGMAGWLMPLRDRPLPVPGPRAGDALSVRAGPVSEQSLIMLDRAMRERGPEGLPAAYVPAAHPIRASDAL